MLLIKLAVLTLSLIALWPFMPLIAAEQIVTIKTPKVQEHIFVVDCKPGHMNINGVCQPLWPVFCGFCSARCLPGYILLKGECKKIRENVKNFNKATQLDWYLSVLQVEEISEH
ncbi:hypothetical protein Zmor_009247 [Zophobas morio]|uniref:Uncharacterized protein n=1 Tax=Zophobas morio TaxID=2755281 RepID=A0AA38MII8_9CUCU|nr:hypothetical protein Zmor_009247 [Zophobas morio]